MYYVNVRVFFGFQWSGEINLYYVRFLFPFLFACLSPALVWGNGEETIPCADGIVKAVHACGIICTPTVPKVVPCVVQHRIQYAVLVFLCPPP